MPEKRAMNSTMPYDRDSDRMQTTGNVVFLLAVSSLLAVMLCTFAFFSVLSSDSGSTGQIAHFGRVVGSYLGVFALVAFSIELLTIGLLAISAVRWQISILHDTRWVASVVCAMLAFLITIALMFLYVIAATSHA